MLNEPEKKIESSDKDELVDEKLSHLNSKDAEAVKRTSETTPKSLPIRSKICDHQRCQSLIVLD